MGTAGRVPLFMPMSDGIHFLPGAFGRQVVQRLGKESSLRGPAIDIEALKRVYDALLTESKATFTFYTSVIGAETSGGKINHVVCAAPSGLFAVRAKIYIDATGNGDLAVRAGAKFEKGDDQTQLMPGTLCSVWAGIDWKTWYAAQPKNCSQPDASMLKKAFADGVFTVHDQHLTGMYQLGDDLGAGNIGHTFDVDGTDEVSLTKALVQGRKTLVEFHRYYKEYLKGFEKLQLVATGSLLGVRETRRILGDYVLSLDDYLRRADFPDEIGRFSYWLDYHPTQPDKAGKHREIPKEKLWYKKGESYGIPYRILIPRGLANLLVAGRCVSVDCMVHSSIRVQPGCFITGQAAGVAGAMAALGSVSTRAVAVKELQQRLKQLGGYLPNA